LSLKKFDVKDDIYYKKKYISLYLDQSQEIFEFEYKEDEKLFYNIAIKTPIIKIGNKKLTEKYYDLETVYGYGGICCNTDEKAFIDKALKLYSKYCFDNKIISEFTRFHPFNTSHSLMNSYYDLLIEDRDIVYVDTSITKEKRWKNYSSKMRTILRKCNKDLIFRRSTHLDSFQCLYKKTMQKNNADSFYFFDETYFEKLLLLKNIELYEVLYNNVVISSSFFMFSENFGHYHLSANDYEYRKCNANYFILDCIFEIAYEKNIPVFHLGGGRSNYEDDTLLKFKEKFSYLKKKFYISGKIFDKKIYDKYIAIWKSQSNKDVKYFLKYRWEI